MKEEKDQQNDASYITLTSTEKASQELDIYIRKPQNCKQSCIYFLRDLADITISLIFFMCILWITIKICVNVLGIQDM